MRFERRDEGASRFDQPDTRERRIGLTPLIDVVFLLLIFFMLASQLGQQRVLGIEVSNAGVASGSIDDEAGTIQLSAIGELRIAEYHIPLGAPTAVLRNALAEGDRDRLLLVADAEANVQQITRALVDLERAGAGSVQLVGER